MATNVYSFPTGPLTGLDVNPTLDFFLAGKNGPAIVQNTTQQIFAGPNDTQIRFNGFGFQYDPAGNGIAGTLLSVQIVTFDAANNLVNQEFTLTSVGENSFAAFYAALNTSALDAVKFLMSDNDTVFGSATNDDLAGHNGNDTLNGNGGDDHMVGGLGDDTYNGGTGVDEIDYSDAIGRPAAELPAIPHGVFVNLTGGFAFDYNGPGAGFIETFTSIENATGTQFGDFFFGNGADNTFRGLGGNDTLNGAAGFDTAAYDRDAQLGGAAGVTVDLGAGTATDGFGQTDTLVSIEDAIGTASNDSLTGSNVSNELRGLGGDDVLTAVIGGTDNLIGGTGNDTYNVNAIFPVQIVNEEDDGGDGIDTVVSSVGWNLGDTFRNRGNVENLTLTGAAALVGLGNALGNVINGNSGNNFLDGVGGNDTINGNDGDDTVEGGLGNDILGGGAGDDILRGEGGNDSLDGGAGVNTLEGGLGNDTYHLGAKPDGEDSIDDTGGNDTVTSTISRSLQFFSTNDATNIENLQLLGTDNLNGSGSAGANTLTGNAGNNALFGLDGNDVLFGLGGNDILIGGAGNDGLRGGDGNDQLVGGEGNDDMQGGAGNDTYTVDSAGDTVIDTSGIDTVLSAVSVNAAGFTGIENIRLIGIADAAVNGNAEANVIVGNSGNNVLSGSGGNDVIRGFDGNDRLNGGVGNDWLRGDDGDDTMNGGPGIDTLQGGDGNDNFDFTNAPGQANRDIFVDFAHNEDTIRLAKVIFSAFGAAIDANEIRTVGTGAQDANDFLLYNQGTGVLFYDPNGNGAGGNLAIATLLNKPVLDASDFALI